MVPGHENPFMSVRPGSCQIKFAQKARKKTEGSNEESGGVQPKKAGNGKREVNKR